MPPEVEIEERQHLVDSRGTKNSRLIGRSIRSVIDLQSLEMTITLDCDVIEADGEPERPQ